MKVRSHSDRRKFYDVDIKESGMVECTCPYFEHRLKRKQDLTHEQQTCKHIDEYYERIYAVDYK